MKKDIYYVYIVRYKGEIVYIGKGKYRRYEHVNSGCSHIYEANRLHHNEGAVFDVTITHKNSTDEFATAKEKELILKLQPKWNGRGKGDYENATAQLMVDIKSLIVSAPDFPTGMTRLREKRLKATCAIIREVMRGVTNRSKILVHVPDAYSLLKIARSATDSSTVENQNYLYRYITIDKVGGRVIVTLSEDGRVLVEQAKKLRKRDANV